MELALFISDVVFATDGLIYNDSTDKETDQIRNNFNFDKNADYPAH